MRASSAILARKWHGASLAMYPWRVGRLVLTLALAACGPAPAPPPAERISVQLNWLPQAQHGGLFAADQTGLYRAEALAVRFVPGGPTVDSVGAVVGGASQFGVAGADELILARAKGQPVQAIATVFRRSPVVFVARADSGITRPEDFVGKTIRVTPNLVPTLHSMMARVGVPPDRYREVTLPSEVEAFRAGQAPVWGVYLNAFAVALQQAGIQLTFIFPDDYGVHFYADTLFTTDERVAASPELVTRFLRASLRGWTYAVEHPAAVGPMVVRYQADADAGLETARMTASLPLVNTGEDRIGWMKPEIWAGMERTLREQGVLRAPVDVTQVYTTRFLDAVYGSTR